MLSFHATLHVRPESATDGGTVDVGGRTLARLNVPQDGVGTPFPTDFESAAASLTQLDRMFVEPDGSFVWVSPRDMPAWQVDGQLFDRAGRLLFVDLKGSCPADQLDRLLAALGWPVVRVMFQLAREAVFVSDQEFRRCSAVDRVASLKVDGLVARPLELAFADLAAMDVAAQVIDVSRLDPKRKGDAVRLTALLELAGVTSEAKYLTLHSTADDFHASLPLSAILERAIVIYQVEGKPLPVAAGGPFRFLIPDFAACHTAEVDECANVKFVDWIEISENRGHDNRPHDDAEHAALHDQQ